ncbi:MAG TPA: phosphoribosyltransferase family protein [Bacteriovoracaceae bacterium]|nr:phosphoribosyltransferase family protein [Bacteriovoracaceae bacterium]
MLSRNAAFKDRQEAGKELAHIIKNFNFHAPVILALPRGGVILGREVALLLKVPLDVLISRKLGAPGNAEYGIGAVSEDEIPFYITQALEQYGCGSEDLGTILDTETLELRRRIRLYRGGRPLDSVKGQTVLLIDDGLATGVTAVAAARFLKSLAPGKLILAVPVAPAEIPLEVAGSFDQIICPNYISNFYGVGVHYQNFEQVEDAQVLQILQQLRG